MASSTLDIRVENGCMNQLVWGCALPDEAEPQRVLEALVRRGFADQSKFDFLWMLEDAQENTVVMVPRNGRVQFRISYLIPIDDRRAEAERLAELVAACCEELREVA